MILYQLTNWLEERGALKKAVALQNGGTPEQLRQLEDVERRLSGEAQRFMQAYSRVPFVQEPYIAPHLDEDVYI